MIGTMKRSPTHNVAGKLLALGAALLLTVLPARAAENLAFKQPVTASAALWPNFPTSFLTDGDNSTFTHPATGVATLGFEFEVDLGREVQFDRIVLRNRGDGCCPERLSRYRVELYADNGGESGALNWSGLIRGDGSNSGVGGVDVVRATAGSGPLFGGRFIRIVNTGGASHSPQIAEIEAYGAAGPEILLFAADDDNLATGASTTLRWNLRNATGAEITPEVGAISPTNGSVVVHPAATTTYVLRATNAAATAIARVTVGFNVPLAPPELTEFLASNVTGLEDEDGEKSDWIELRNPNPLSLPLEGYSLTDDPKNRRKWVFPKVRIPPGGYLTVFASGNDRRDPAAPLHTSFGLAAGGEYLALVARDGVTVLGQFPAEFPTVATFPPQFPDISYGRGANQAVGFFRPPTPGGTNGVPYAGVVEAVSFSRPRGFYDTPFTLTLGTTTVGAEIRYTTNLTEPTATSGLVYTAPLTLTNTRAIRAAAFRPGWAPARVTTHTYVFPTNVIASAVMRRSVTTNAAYAPRMRAALLQVPSVSIVTPLKINGSGESKASFEWLWPDGQPGVQEDCGVRNYGGDYTDFAKKNFRLYFRGEYGATKLRHPLFAGFERGLRVANEFDQLELRSGSHDMEMRGFYLSNIFTDETMIEMGQLNPHGRFVHLYLNGTYWGLFHLRERWNAAMHQSYLGGSRTNYESINGNLNVGGWAEPGSPYDGDGSIWAKIKSLRGNYAAVRPWLDVPEYADYMLMWMFGGSEDEYRCTGPNVPGSGMKFYLNDADGWFCVPNYCAAGDRTGRGAPGRSGGDGPGSLFSMLFKEGTPEYRILLADRIHRALFNDGALTPTRNAARLRARTDEIADAFLAESARWNYLTPAVWQQRRDSVQTSWLPTRTATALSQYRGAGFYPATDAPVPTRRGGIVTNGFPLQFTGPGTGTIYFTLDGSDPRLPNGAISPAAQSFHSGLTVQTPVPAGSRWRWFTDANGLGSSDVVEGHPAWAVTNWKHPNFADAAWAEGPAQLGFGESDEATVLPFGGIADAKWITAYFRHRFVLARTNDLTSLILRLKRDDGAIIYLNGQELARSSMPTGPADGATPAENAPDDGQSFNPLSGPVTLLRSGTNVLAVEMHQSGPGSSDLSFDLELAVTLAGDSSGSTPKLTRNTVVRARTLNGNEWSALNENFYQVGDTAVAAGDLQVSELNYNPAGTDGTEFVEVLNASARAVNLRGAGFSSGIQFTFPDNRDTLLAPGQRLVLVKDLFAFQQRYGYELPVAGIYAGDLNNTGETLTLKDAAGAALFSFAYGTTGSWPAADGTGHSLVLARPEFGLGNPLAWRVSATTNATPGATDAVLLAGDPNADADLDGLTALLEHAFGTSDLDPASGPGALSFEPGSAAGFVLRFPRNLRADDVELSAEASSDLAAWEPAFRADAVARGDGTATETWVVPDQGQTAVFLRVRVTRR